MARSPSYPGIDLEEAVEKARTLWSKEGRNAAPVETVLKHWGWGPNSGGGRTAVAALKKFGLTEDHGRLQHRQVRLTDLALKIIRDDREDSAERRAALQEAALAPPIHLELWDKYGHEMPSDGTIAYYLKIDRDFTDSGAKELIDEYRRTLAFAGLDEPGSIERHEEPLTEQQPSLTGGLGRPVTPAAPASVAAPAISDVRSFRMPLPGGGVAALETSRPLTEEEWMTLTSVLDAMKLSFLDGDE